MPNPKQAIKDLQEAISGLSLTQEQQNVFQGPIQAVQASYTSGSSTRDESLTQSLIKRLPRNCPHSSPSTAIRNHMRTYKISLPTNSMSTHSPTNKKSEQLSKTSLKILKHYLGLCHSYPVWVQPSVRNGSRVGMGVTLPTRPTTKSGQVSRPSRRLRDQD